MHRKAKIPLFFPFVKSEGTRKIIPLGTIPLATIEKFNKMVSFYTRGDRAISLVLIKLGSEV